MISVRLAETKDDVVLAYQAYAAMHAEGLAPADATLSPLKVLTNLFRFMNGPASVLLLVMDGESLAGVLALVESGYWFSETGRFIEDKGLYVAPAYRDGDAIKLLLSAAQETGDDAGCPVFITIFNGQRKRGSHSQWERVGATLGYINKGAILAHYPES